MDFDGKFVSLNADPEKRVSLSEVAFASQFGHMVPLEITETHTSPLSPPPYMVGAAEIELDKETGEVKVVDYAACVDCGTPINPNLTRVQAEGGILQGIGMTEKLALPTLIALCSIALGKPTLSSLAVLGEISIAGTMLKVDELANALQVCLDSGAKKVLLPITSAADLGTAPADLIGCFNLIFYQSAEDAVYKALGVE